MIRDQPFVIARQPVQNPISSDDVEIVERAVDKFRVSFVPACPGGPIKILSVKARGHLIRLVIKKALANAKFLRAILVLQAAPQDAVHKLLKLAELFLIRQPQLFHDRCHP